MTGEVFDFRQFQTVRDNLCEVGLSPKPLYDQLRKQQRIGMRGNAIVAIAQKLNKQFRDELSPGAA